MFRIRMHAPCLIVCWVFSPLVALGHEQDAHAHDSDQRRVAKEMQTAAARFLGGLSDEQRALAVYELTDQERQNWHFLPDKFIKPDGKRYGLSMERMSADQRAMAHALLASGLSQRGFLTAMTVTSLEQILYKLEDGSPIRNPARYYVTIFGNPGDSRGWGWRFEGHHLSINVTIVGGKLFSVTPAFFGANPGVVKEGPQKGLQTLRDEEELARQLVTSLSTEQQKAAVLSNKAPDDILTKENRAVESSQFDPAKGVAYGDLGPKQRELLLQLVKTYAHKFRPEIVDQIHDRTKIFDLRRVYFAWSGGFDAGVGHYYRVQTPKFLFEYDNTQNNANHVHAVWRDFSGDFGADLLKAHYEAHHSTKNETARETADAK